MKKTILFVHSSNELYGADRSLYKIIQGLDRTQIFPIVVLPTDIAYTGELSQLLEQDGITVYQVKMGVLRRRYLSSWRIILFVVYTLWGMWFLHRIVQRHQVQIIYSNSSAVINGHFASKIAHIPHIWQIREYLLKPHWFVNILHKFILKNADKIICNSHAVAHHIQADYQNNPKFKVIWNSIDTREFSPEIDGQAWRAQQSIQDDTVCFGVVGRIKKQKGQNVFIEAAHIMIEHCQNVEFCVIGDAILGEETQLATLKETTLRLGLADKFHFMPFIDTVPEAMRALDVLVLPSILPEAFGRVVIEAMASERSVIATNSGGVCEIVLDEQTGLLVEIDSAEALAQAMIKLAQEPDLRNTMGIAGRQRAVDYFDDQVLWRQYAELITSF